MDFAFNLDKPSSDKPTYIFVMASCFDDRLKYSIKEKILPNHWSKEFQLPVMVKDKALQEDYEALERKLTRIKNGLRDMIRSAKIENRPITKAQAEFEIDILMGKTKRNNNDNFFQAAEAIVSDMASGMLLTDRGKRFSKATLVNYNQSLRCLRDFRPIIKFSEIDVAFYNAFVKHMNDSNLSLSSSGTHIKCLKRLLALSFDRGIHKNGIFLDKKGFKTPTEQTEDIALSEEEIKAMWNKRLLNKNTELARDWFVLDCYTGLRISDIKLLTTHNISKATIIIATEKTDEPVEIPMNAIVRSIIKKYKGLPPKLSDQEINREIKKVGELAGINETVLFSITKGGIRQDTYHKKFEMISNHTARRSFITNLRKSGVPDSIVMKLSGIKKPATLARYDKLSAKDAAKEASKHRFFK